MKTDSPAYKLLKSHFCFRKHSIFVYTNERSSEELIKLILEILDHDDRLVTNENIIINHIEMSFPAAFLNPKWHENKDKSDLKNGRLIAIIITKNGELNGLEHD